MSTKEIMLGPDHPKDGLGGHSTEVKQQLVAFSSLASGGE